MGLINQVIEPSEHDQTSEHMIEPSDDQASERVEPVDRAAGGERGARREGGREESRCRAAEAAGDGGGARAAVWLHREVLMGRRNGSSYGFLGALTPPRASNGTLKTARARALSLRGQSQRLAVTA